MAKNSIWNDEDIVNSDFPNFFRLSVAYYQGLVPQPESEPRPQQWKHQVLSGWPGNSRDFPYFLIS